MAMSVSILAVVTSLHLIAFVFAVGAERRRSTAKVVPDEYDEQTYCVCLCFGKGLVTGSSSTTCAIVFFIVSWISFLGAEACLLAGSAKNAYHTKYRGIFGGNELSCATLRKGVFAAGAALTLLSLIGSILYYWAHSRADTGGWQKHHNEGLGMTTQPHPHPHPPSEYEKA
ncbi:hypothetical protein Pint_22096 [Pistacia integerrima]|uniref:Uncharacterized protein n=1 Tax=Pistacia integerrima TaxID=434235 RepID=A0ACC0YKS7_9ROSI|nr:hypothetical protein Pint_22096 [Pistacia integerrima]